MRPNLQRETENQSEVRILMLVLLKMGDRMDKYNKWGRNTGRQLVKKKEKDARND